MLLIFSLLRQDLRKCHNQRLVRDTISLIATFKYDRSVTHPTKKICQLRKSYEKKLCLVYRGRNN
jgi:hypothetical protein